MDGQVFGKVAGHEAAVEAMSMRGHQEVSPNQIRGFLSRLKERNYGRNAVEARQDIQSVTSTFAGIIRTEKGLRTGLKTLARVRREGIAVDQRGWAYALETANVLDVAEMVLRACRIRKESRGPHLFFAHFEDSQPQLTRDPDGRKYAVIQK